MEQQLRQIDSKQLMYAGLIAGALFTAYIINKGSAHSGRYGAPCYCKKCEDNLIVAANGGDAVAQQKLAMAIQGGQYEGKVLGFDFGVFTWIIGVFILVFIVSRVGGFGQKYGQPMSNYMEGQLRGR